MIKNLLKRLPKMETILVAKREIAKFDIRGIEKKSSKFSAQAIRLTVPIN